MHHLWTMLQTGGRSGGECLIDWFIGRFQLHMAYGTCSLKGVAQADQP